MFEIQTLFIFRAIWENTALVQWIKYSPEGSHLILWTSAILSHIALKWTPFAYRLSLTKELIDSLVWQIVSNYHIIPAICLVALKLHHQSDESQIQLAWLSAYSVDRVQSKHLCWQPGNNTHINYFLIMWLSQHLVAVFCSLIARNLNYEITINVKDHSNKWIKWCTVLVFLCDYLFSVTTCSTTFPCITFNPLGANHEYNRSLFAILADQITVSANAMRV